MFSALFAAALAVSTFALQPARLERRRETLPNGWTYEEPGNNCTATRTHSGAWVQLRLTRWNDLSDSILFHRPGLPPLWSEEGLTTGRTPAEEEADAEAGYHLQVRIDGRPVETTPAFTSMILAHEGRPGPTYRIGIRQQPFIRALRTGRALELLHRGRRLAAIPIRGSAEIARRMSACVARPVR
jgi:hypothetical protein